MSILRYYANKIESHIDPLFWDERMCSFGENNADKTFYVIRRSDKNVGLLSIYTYVLGKIKYALENGFVPVVDLQNYKCSYTNNKSPGKENAWRYFFEQVNSYYDLCDVYHSKKVVLSDSIVPKDMPNVGMKFLQNQCSINVWRKIAEENIRLNTEVIRKIDQEYDNLFNGIDSSDILGVLLRGTDYVNLQPKNHPKQPTLAEAISRVYELLDLYGCRYIYLTTEDEDLLAGMVNEFGSILKYSNVPRYRHNISGYLSDEKRNVKNDFVQKGLDYIIPIGVISKLSHFFAGRSSGSVAAVIMSSTLEKVDFWDTGVY